MGSIPQLSICKGLNKPLKPKLLHRTFEELVDKKAGEQTALIYINERGDEQRVNYNTLNSTSNRIASSILEQIQNKEPNDDGDFLICVCMKPSESLIIAILAILKCGAAYLPLDVNFPETRIFHILNEAKPVLIIHDDDYDGEKFFGTSFVATKFSELKANSMNLSNANIEERKTLTRGTSDLGIVLYTSGSSGIPKGVRLRHYNIQNRLEWQWRKFPYSSTESHGIFKTSLTFVDSVSEIFGPLLNGMCLVIVRKEVTKDPSKLIDVLERYKIERLVLVPSLLRSLLLFLSLQGNGQLSNLKIWVCSGEPLNLQLSKEFFDYFNEDHILCNFYGSTEIMGDVTYFVCESKKQLDNFERIPIGNVIDNTTIYLLNDNFRPVRNGEIGELYAAGANVVPGYVNGRDKERFIDNPLAIDINYSKIYKTGDFASIQKGLIYYEGRIDSQIKIRGHRVDLSEVEKNFVSLDYIEKGIVLCYHAGELDQALVAFGVLNKSDEGEQHEKKTSIQIENDLKLKLAEYMVPQVLILENIPLLVNGKIDRQTLLKMYENNNNNCDVKMHVEMDFCNISNAELDKATVLFKTVAETIGRGIRSKISIHSNFYELGGNSLNSIYTVTQLREKGYFISITDFISAKSLGEIIGKLKMLSDEENVDPSKCDLDMQSDLKLECLPLALEHKADVIEIITNSFYDKADIEQYIKEEISRTDYADILEAIWDDLVEKNLSFILKDSNNRSVSVALNFDAHDEPEVEIKSKLVVIFEFLEFLEGPIRDNHLPKGLNKILHSFMMATSNDLDAKDNIFVMHFMEKEVLKLASRKKFEGILTTNTSPLTQQLGSNVYGYETMLEYPINKYVYRDGSRPFKDASDDKTVIVHWKNIASH